MKKLVFAALLAAGTSIALFSCNNGAYDAEPTESNNALNPLNPNSGVTVPLGTVKVMINGTPTLFYPASYIKDSASDMFIITAMQAEDPILQHRLTFGIWDIKSLKEFQYSGSYAFLDTAKHSPDSFVVYSVGPNNTGSLTMLLTGREDGNLRGTFSGTFHRIFPEANLQDMIKMTNGEFYVPERK